MSDYPGNTLPTPLPIRFGSSVASYRTAQKAPFRTDTTDTSGRPSSVPTAATHGAGSSLPCRRGSRCGARQGPQNNGTRSHRSAERPPRYVPGDVRITGHRRKIRNISGRCRNGISERAAGNTGRQHRTAASPNDRPTTDRGSAPQYRRPGKRDEKGTRRTLRPRSHTAMKRRHGRVMTFSALLRRNPRQFIIFAVKGNGPPKRKPQTGWN